MVGNTDIQLRKLGFNFSCKTSTNKWWNEKEKWSMKWFSSLFLYCLYDETQSQPLSLLIPYSINYFNNLHTKKFLWIKGCNDWSFLYSYVYRRLSCSIYRPNIQSNVVTLWNQRSRIVPAGMKRCSGTQMVESTEYWTSLLSMLRCTTKVMENVAKAVEVFTEQLGYTGKV